MVNGRCFTNLDDFRAVDWPRKFAVVPRIGDRVEGKRGDNLPTLKVVGVTHCCDAQGNPYIEVELHR